MKVLVLRDTELLTLAFSKAAWATGGWACWAVFWYCTSFTSMYSSWFNRVAADLH